MRTVAEEEKRKSAQLIAELRTVDSWLLKRNLGITPCEVTNANPTIPSTPYASLESLFCNQLPPSLQRNDLSKFTDAEVCEWG